MQKNIRRILNIMLIIVFLIIDIQAASMKVHASSLTANSGSWFDELGNKGAYFLQFITSQIGAVHNGDFRQTVENFEAYKEWLVKLKEAPLEIRTHSSGGRDFDVVDIPTEYLDELRAVIEEAMKKNSHYFIFYPKTIADVSPGSFEDMARYTAFKSFAKEKEFFWYSGGYLFPRLEDGTNATRLFYVSTSSSWTKFLSGDYSGTVRQLCSNWSSVEYWWYSYQESSGKYGLNGSSQNYDRGLKIPLSSLHVYSSSPVLVFDSSTAAKNYLVGYSDVYLGGRQYSPGTVTVPVDAQIDYDKLYATVQDAIVEASSGGTPMDLGEIETLINDTVAAALKEINDSIGNIEDDIGDIGGDVEQANSWLEKIYDRLGAMDEGNTALMQEIASRLDAMGSDALKLSDFNRWMQKLYDSLDGLSPGEPVDHTAVLESILDKLTVLDRIEDAVSESNRLLGDIIDRLGGVDDANAYLSSILEKLDGLGTDNSAQYEKFNQWLQKIYDELKGSEELGPVLDGIAKKLDSIGGDIQLSNEILQDIYDRLGNTEHMDNLFGHLGERLEDGFKSVVQSLDVILSEIKSFKRWFIADSVLDAVNDILEGDTHPGTFRSIWDLMKRKFPFCLVWDFVNMVGLLLYAGAQDTPVFTVPFQMDSIDFYYEFTIDFTVFGKCITVLKFFMVLFYCRMLMFISMRVTAGKG